ncbi:MAG TPA: histidine kinase, partial [Dermatophilaceae bacterium]|nr:histidine kinase [Dermatophilaceae bacterium]
MVVATSPQRRVPALWVMQLCVGMAAVVAYYVLVPEQLVDPVGVVIGVFGVVSIVWGVHVWRPESRAPWYLLAAGVAFYVLGDFIYMRLAEQYGSEPPFPSVADVAYYALYPLVGASLFLTMRRQMPGRDRAGLVDAALITVAAGILTWTFLMAPYASDPTLQLSEKLASIGYPLGDLLLIALLARLLLTPGKRVVTFRLLVAALVVNLVADIVYAFQLLAGTFASGGLVDVGWLTAYVLFGTAALHPSMRQYGQQVGSVASPSNRRLVVMAAAALTAPALIAARALRGNYDEIAVIAAGCMVMFLLVLIRMSGLLDEVESQHDQLQTAFSDLEQAQSERKLLLDRTVHAAEEERIRLAANLHDGPIQRLASVSLTLDRAMLRLDRGDPVVASDLLERGQGELQAEVDALRRMMSELRPPILDEAGFEAGVRDLVDDFAQRSHVGGRVSGTLLTPLAADTETALYRVVQEALWNVAKHADATAVEVELLDLGGIVELTVADDGRGFRQASSTSLLRDGHFGLVGMRERLESTGGMLVV